MISTPCGMMPAMIDILTGDDMPSCLMSIASKSPRTALRYAAAYKSFFGGELDAVRFHEFLALSHDVASKRLARYLIVHSATSASTHSVFLSAMRTLIQEARRYHETDLSLEIIPKRTQRPQAYRDTRGISKQQLQSLLLDVNDRDRAIIMLLAVAGLRRAELCSLRVKDFEYASRHLHVASKGLSGQREVMTVSDAVAEAIQAYLGSRQLKPSTPLIMSRLGKGITPTGVMDVIQRLSSRRGFECTPHMLRHTAATLSLDAGALLEETQALMRHRCAATTQRYDSNRKRYAGSAMNKLVEFLK